MSEPFFGLLELQRAAKARATAKDEELLAAYEKIAELTAALADCRAYLEEHVDIVDGDYGEQRPNKAMQLVSAIDESIYGPLGCF